MAEFLETLKGYWWLVTGPLWLGMLGVVWWLKTQFATKTESEKQFAAVNKAIADIGAGVETYADQTEVRLTRLETATKHLPDREAFHALTNPGRAAKRHDRGDGQDTGQHGGRCRPPGGLHDDEG